MRKIIFTGQTQSNYAAIVRSSSSLNSRPRPTNNSFNSKTKSSNLDKRNSALKKAATTLTYLSMGNKLGRKVDKNIQDFKNSGPKSRLGKITNDAKIGASGGAALGFIKGAGSSLTTPGSVKKKIAYGLGHATRQALNGGIGGGSLGAGIGTARGFVQPNKKKSFLDKFKK